MDATVQVILEKLKSQGVFDKVRKSCLADLESTSEYENLMNDADKFVNAFLDKQAWPPKIGKLELREELRKNLANASVIKTYLDGVVQRAISNQDQETFVPNIERAVAEYFGLDHETWINRRKNCLYDETGDSSFNTSMEYSKRSIVKNPSPPRMDVKVDSDVEMELDSDQSPPPPTSQPNISTPIDQKRTQTRPSHQDNHAPSGEGGRLSNSFMEDLEHRQRANSRGFQRRHNRSPSSSSDRSGHAQSRSKFHSSARRQGRYNEDPFNDSWENRRRSESRSSPNRSGYYENRYNSRRNPEGDNDRGYSRSQGDRDRRDYQQRSKSRPQYDRDGRRNFNRYNEPHGGGSRNFDRPNNSNPPNRHYRNDSRGNSSSHQGQYGAYGRRRDDGDGYRRHRGNFANGRSYDEASGSPPSGAVARCRDSGSHGAAAQFRRKKEIEARLREIEDAERRVLNRARTPDVIPDDVSEGEVYDPEQL